MNIFDYALESHIRGELSDSAVREMLERGAELFGENERLKHENDKLHCQDCAGQAFEVACILQEYKEKNEQLQVQVAKAREALRENKDRAITARAMIDGLPLEKKMTLTIRQNISTVANKAHIAIAAIEGSGEK
jgi:hypothetical protein